MTISNVRVESLQGVNGKWQPYGLYNIQDGPSITDARRLLDPDFDTKEQADNFFRRWLQGEYGKFVNQ